MIYNNPKVKVGEKVKVFYNGTTGIYKVAAIISPERLIIEVPKVNGNIEGWLGSNNPSDCQIYDLSPDKKYWHIYYWKKAFIEIEL